MSDSLMAAAVEGELTPWERKSVLRHLAACQQCTAELVELHTTLRNANLLPPVPLRHPLEEALLWLRRLVPLPPWVWHGALLLLICLGWYFAVDMSAVLWLRDPVYTFPPFLSVILMTTHFVWLQPRLRQVHLALWQGGVSRAAIDSFQYRYFAALQGRLLLSWRGKGGITIGPLWTWFALTVLIQIANILRLPGAMESGDNIVALILGFYPLLTTTIAQWGWLLGGYYLIGLARLLSNQGIRIAEGVVQPVRHLALGWLLIGSGGMIWYYLAALPTGKANEPGVTVLIVQNTLMLLVLWVGYVRLEVALARKNHPFWGWGPAVARLVVTLVLVLGPMFIQSASRFLVAG